MASVTPNSTAVLPVTFAKPLKSGLLASSRTTKLAAFAGLAAVDYITAGIGPPLSFSIVMSTKLFVSMA